MAVRVLDILFGGQSTTEIQSLSRSFKFDAVISRAHSMSSQIPDSVIEDGSTITDHVILDPRTLTIEAMVSDHPIDRTARTAAAASAQTRSETAAALLESLWEGKELLRVVTRLHIYRDMVIERLDFSESAEVGEALSVSMSLRAIRKASLVTVPIAKLAAAQKDLAAGKIQRGRKAPKAAKSAQLDSLRKAAVAAGHPGAAPVQSVTP